MDKAKAKASSDRSDNSLGNEEPTPQKTVGVYEHSASVNPPRSKQLIIVAAIVVTLLVIIVVRYMG